MQIRFQRRFRVMFSACFSLYILYVIFCFTFVPVLSLSLTSSLKFFDVSPLDEIIDTHIELNHLVEESVNFFVNAYRKNKEAPFPFATVRNHLGGIIGGIKGLSQLIRPVSTETTQRLWATILRHDESAHQKSRELPLVGAPALFMLYSAERMLHETVHIAEMDDEKNFEVLLDEGTVYKDRMAARKLFTHLEAPTSPTTHPLPRFHLLISQPAICVNGQLTIITRDDSKKLYNMLPKVFPPVDLKELLLYDCFPITLRQQLRKWANLLFPVPKDYPGYNLRLYTLSFEAFIHPETKTAAVKHLMQTTLQIDNYLYCELSSYYFFHRYADREKRVHDICDALFATPRVGTSLTSLPFISTAPYDTTALVLPAKVPEKKKEKPPKQVEKPKTEEKGPTEDIVEKEEEEDEWEKYETMKRKREEKEKEEEWEDKKRKKEKKNLEEREEEEELPEKSLPVIPEEKIAEPYEKGKSKFEPSKYIPEFEPEEPPPEIEKGEPEKLLIDAEIPPKMAKIPLLQPSVHPSIPVKAPESESSPQVVYPREQVVEDKHKVEDLPFTISHEPAAKVLKANVVQPSKLRLPETVEPPFKEGQLPPKEGRPSEIPPEEGKPIEIPPFEELINLLSPDTLTSVHIPHKGAEPPKKSKPPEVPSKEGKPLGILSKEAKPPKVPPKKGKPSKVPPEEGKPIGIPPFEELINLLSPDTLTSVHIPHKEAEPLKEAEMAKAGELVSEKEAIKYFDPEELTPLHKLHEGTVPSEEQTTLLEAALEPKTAAAKQKTHEIPPESMRLTPVTIHPLMPPRSLTSYDEPKPGKTPNKVPPSGVVKAQATREYSAVPHKPEFL